MKRFIHYVELQTKITSVFASALTLLFLIYKKHHLDMINTLIFLSSMFLFDLTTTAINNYIDAKGNGAATGYSNRDGRRIIILLLGISTVLGLLLVFRTDWVVLVLGILSFITGIVYTFGPVPISRQPYGEIISGVMYGYMIPFLLIYINDPNLLVAIQANLESIAITIHLVPIIEFAFIFAIPTLLTASIMLANNTCDIKKDVEVKRYTLPYYLGQEHAVELMKWLYISLYIILFVSIVLQILPISCILLTVLIPSISRNYNLFKKDLIKDVSFKFIIKNFIIIMFSYCLTVAIAIVINTL